MWWGITEADLYFAFRCLHHLRCRGGIFDSNRYQHFTYCISSPSFLSERPCHLVSTPGQDGVPLGYGLSTKDLQCTLCFINSKILKMFSWKIENIFHLLKYFLSFYNPLIMWIIANPKRVLQRHYVIIWYINHRESQLINVDQEDKTL